MRAVIVLGTLLGSGSIAQAAAFPSIGTRAVTEDQWTRVPEFHPTVRLSRATGEDLLSSSKDEDAVSGKELSSFRSGVHSGNLRGGLAVGVVLQKAGQTRTAWGAVASYNGDTAGREAAEHFSTLKASVGKRAAQQQQGEDGITQAYVIVDAPGGDYYTGLLRHSAVRIGSLIEESLRDISSQIPEQLNARYLIASYGIQDCTGETGNIALGPVGSSAARVNGNKIDEESWLSLDEAMSIIKSRYN